ncbi:flagella basal body P-ring formation protein FlgA [Sphingomonas sp. So64.6b]|uniref:flagella basal body P-ring formation protein FlgA n=1 Tax=Sphingomonas sp. So64.6b TaxID=2997354 RepID=UPI001600EBCC|nr:flagella basal body P-ring formation protein FlgA [Sphingomonas sp. So64.6b]QNA85733.1 flagella basal body P-ring formation protein FlgA [Sphingomonas sp. So64.6b]
MFRPFLAALLPALMIAAPASAAPFQDTVSLDRAVAAFTGRGIGDLGGARSVVDGRLKLAQCATLALSWRSDAHDAVVVSCTGPEWRIFVPVRFAATEPRKAAPQTVAAVIPAPKVDPVIKRGDPVTIEAGSPGFSITREGVAAGDAAPGGRFLVKIDGGRAPVQAVAVASGRATLPGWAE